MTARADGKNAGRVFTVELNSRAGLKKASVGQGTEEGILIEGTLGTLTSAGFLDEVVLEVVGTEGVLRLDLQSQEIRRTGRGTPADMDGSVKA